ncbi:MAG TPA: sulfatase-like hydrolase/transferase [Pirellulaceae bacterium]|nr:sulfatase-like hydrolase/transferase [Pirellulaceae bacterium]
MIRATLLACLVLLPLSLPSEMFASEPPVPASDRRADDPRPNIVLIFADDLGINDLGCYGRAEHRTPRLDRLASEGIRFTRAYTAQPICSPSRAALLTGLHPARLHLTNYLPGRPDAPTQRVLQPVIEGQLPLEEVTLAELLRDAGYATGLFGKWHLGNGPFGPAAQGFETVVTPPGDSMPGADEEGKSERAITRAAEAFIEANRERPFFCYVPHHSPHIPLRASDERIARHADAFHPTYAAMIETLDESVGRLLDQLERLGLTERTIVIFTSDNGGLHVLEFPGNPATHNTPYRGGKGFLYEGGLREPLIVRWPQRIRSGSECGTPVVLSDLMPTLLEMAGLDPSKITGPLDGVSLMPLLKDQSLPERDLFWHLPNYTNQGGRPSGAILSRNHKLIEHFEDGRRELFDLSVDPGERHDLSEIEPERTAELAARLAAWRERVGAQMSEPNPEFDPAAHALLYVDRDPSLVETRATADETGSPWVEWRAAMNRAVQGRSPRVTPPTGDIRLAARDAIVHGRRLRYEPEPFKNVLGYWTETEDWAEWTFDVPAAGRYEIEVQQGCGTGSGGATVDVTIGDRTFPFEVIETGHFQRMILRTIGSVELAAGPQRLAVRPTSKPGVAVMDLRRIVLRPLP